MSVLETDQLEGLRDEVDFGSLELLLPTGATWPLLPAVKPGARLERTIEGASSLKVIVNDHYGKLERSGVLGEDVHIAVDGMLFRLTKVSGSGDDLTLTFEDSAVSLLRAYPRDTTSRHGWRAWPADKVTREQVASELVAEVKERPLVLVTPAGVVPQGLVRASKEEAKKVERGPGFAPGAKLTVKGAAATPEQKDNIRRVLDVGNSMIPIVHAHRRKLLIVAVIVVITESTARNLEGGDQDSRGLFQQRPTGGRPDGKGRWPASRNIETDATAFFEVALSRDAIFPSADEATLASDIQRDKTYGTPDQGRNYARWMVEGEQWVQAYGVYGGDAQDPKSAATQNRQLFLPDDAAIDKANQFVRGSVVKKHGRKFFVREDNWTCIGRLADEVSWRRFVLNDIVYFMDEPSLFASAPQMTLSRTSDGVVDIERDYDIGKRNASVTIICRMGAWQAPPGTTVELENLGVLDGRWLVATVSRDIFSREGEITLKKPRPLLPESEAPEHATDDGDDVLTLRPRKPPKPVDPGKHGKGQYVAPVPGTPMTPGSEFNVPDNCEGVPGAPANIGRLCTDKRSRNYGKYCVHGAKDWYAPAGFDVIAPTWGTVCEVQPSLNHSGQVFGGVVKIQEDGRGKVWVFRHVEPLVSVGQRLEAGDLIARISAWDGGATHTHIEVWKTLAGGYTYDNLIDPVTLLGGDT